MVETLGIGFGGDTEGGPGGGADGGGGGYRRYGYGYGQLVKWGGYCRNHKLRDRA